ncbi:AraC family transcriptional regulator [Bradyrhizobium sp. SHOUNA76]|uniref:AraC family transcriptional regulator n=1 Tax=Bradyrhizobium sp. SHOUNA76 TaxID=2908927 RepID=UPI001FF20466|nr:AraC family transcriptional regulator [Bradyrhizobium sp. SHOUNA76]MCJ9703631.1 AraC family transcriptional regulator [Bradyrhizobium sp. SHOUNA76]
MTQAGAYGDKLGQFLRLKEAPPSLVTRSLRSAELAVTETRNDRPLTGLSGSLTAEDAFLVSLKLRDYPDCELWERGKSIMKADVRAGTTYLYDLKLDPRYVIDKPFHSLFFYIPRSALDSISEQCNSSRIDELDCQIGIGHDDEIIRHIGASLQEGLRRPGEANQLFVDHMMLALTAHVAQAYGGLERRTEPTRGGLAPWQAKRACERLESDLGGKLSLQKIASELDLSVSHFSRAFRTAVGMPPHQWLLHQRVKAAKQLMSVRDLPLTEIAISAGFANQSHFTRVFSSIVGVSPAVWRRQMSSASGAKA